MGLQTRSLDGAGGSADSGPGLELLDSTTHGGAREELASEGTQSWLGMWLEREQPARGGVEGKKT